MKTSSSRSSVDSRAVPLLAAALIVIVTVVQLFAFERFYEVLLSGYPDLFSISGAKLVAAFVVIVEVLAVPCLLPLPLSSWLRWISQGAGWIVVGFWLFLSIYALVKGGIYTALFGAVVSLPGGWWPLLFSLGLSILLVWSSMLRSQKRLS